MSRKEEHGSGKVRITGKNEGKRRETSGEKRRKR